MSLSTSRTTASAPTPGPDQKEINQFQEKHKNDTVSSLGSSRYESDSSDRPYPDILNDDEPKKKKAKGRNRSPSPVQEEAEKDDGEYQYSDYSEENMAKGMVF